VELVAVVTVETITLPQSLELLIQVEAVAVAVVQQRKQTATDNQVALVS
jgi:hypothetical protein